MGGKFDPQALRGAPIELRELAQSFAEATRSAADHAAKNDAAVAQQELLMKEIHHRVKNNLQIVASLLNLQASRIRQPEAKAEFASARDRVRALATLHRHLYSQGEVHTINMRQFLTELCGQLFAAMGGARGDAHFAEYRGERIADVERPGGAAVADRDGGGEQRAEICVSAWTAGERGCFSDGDEGRGGADDLRRWGRDPGWAGGGPRPECGMAWG